MTMPKIFCNRKIMQLGLHKLKIIIIYGDKRNEIPLYSYATKG